MGSSIPRLEKKLSQKQNEEQSQKFMEEVLKDFFKKSQKNENLLDELTMKFKAELNNDKKALGLRKLNNLM